MKKAEKTRTKEYFYSWIENGKVNIHLSSVFKINETDLGQKIHLTNFIRWFYQTGSESFIKWS